MKKLRDGQISKILLMIYSLRMLELMIFYEGNLEGNFEIYSIDGKLITKNSSREYLKTLPKGIYIIGHGKNKYKISI